MKQELVKEWMTRDVLTVTPETTLPEAHRMMTDNHIRRLPVMENGCLVGIVTRGDLRGAEASGATSLSIWELHYLIAKVKIGQIMTTDPITIPQDARISEAAQVMLYNKISGLPVLDGQGKLVGIITESDIFRIVAYEWSWTDSKEPTSALKTPIVAVSLKP